ncbi:MAG: DUF3194 domain-containing protein [Candidatus Methanosuratus sp.]|nr:DUF3194 domain-containing protein [Candidatus Methanosuratincola sp.]
MQSLFTKKELEEICLVGENTAREYVLSVLDRHLISSLNIRVTSEESASRLDFNADIEIEVDPVVETDLEMLADAAADRALEAIDEKVRAKRVA